MRVTGSAISRDVRVGAVLGHDERSAVGGVAAALGRVVAGLEGQVARVCTGGHGDGGGGGSEPEVRETQRQDGDEREGDD